MPSSVTLAIPTHNRADLLAQTLKSLASVKVPENIDAQLVVVADACTDGTIDVFNSARSSLPFEAELIAAELRNLNQGRNLCVECARGEIIIFLDDDVWADPNLIAGHLEVYATTPASITSGQIQLWWRDVARPPWMSDWTASLLTQRKHEGPPKKLQYPYEAAGANFSMKRQVVERIGGFRPGLDRSGSSLLGGGETELIRRALAAGLELWSAPHASVEHYVSKNRVDGTAYVRGVARGLGMSHVYMRDSFGPREITRQLAGRSVIYLKNLMKYFFHTVARNKSAVLDARCHMDLSSGALVATLVRAAGRSPVAADAPVLKLASA